MKSWANGSRKAILIDRGVRPNSVRHHHRSNRAFRVVQIGQQRRQPCSRWARANRARLIVVLRCFYPNDRFPRRQTDNRFDPPPSQRGKHDEYWSCRKDCEWRRFERDVERLLSCAATSSGCRPSEDTERLHVLLIRSSVAFKRLTSREPAADRNAAIAGHPSAADCREPKTRATSGSDSITKGSNGHPESRGPAAVDEIGGPRYRRQRSFPPPLGPSAPAGMELLSVLVAVELPPVRVCPESSSRGSRRL